MGKRAWWVIAWVVVFVPISWGQRFELTGIVGGQLNGGLDLSTSLFRRIDVCLSTSAWRLRLK